MKKNKSEIQELKEFLIIRFDQIDTRFTGIEQRLINVEKVLAEHTVQIGEIKNVLAEHTKQISELKQDINVIKNVLTEHTAQIREIKNVLAEHTVQIREIKNVLAEHTKQISELKQDINVIKDVLTQHTILLTEMKSALESNTYEIKEIKITVNATKNIVRDLHYFVFDEVSNDIKNLKDNDIELFRIQRNLVEDVAQNCASISVLKSKHFKN